MLRRSLPVSFVLTLGLAAHPLVAQPIQKSAIQVDPGNTKDVGATFGYRLTYNCSSTSGPCTGAEVIDLLPAEVQYLSTVPASPAGDVAAIQVTPNYMGTGRTRVRFDLVDPLTAGNSGDLIINVRFPNGSTADGTVATNTADGIDLETTPGTFTTPPVDVTAVASVQTSLQKTLTTSPANLDMPEAYRLRISVPNSNGALDLTAVGPVVDTLPPGTVFQGASPAADCEPGCVGTTPATLTWTSPCSGLPLSPGQNCDIQVNVLFPSATFTSGTNVTNEFTADATPLGEPSQNLGVDGVTHPVTTFAANASVSFAKRVSGPNPPTLDQTFDYTLDPRNNGNVPLDSMEMIDTLPEEMVVDDVTSGDYNNLVGPVTVHYESNLSGGWVLLGSSPATTNTTFPIPALAVGEYLTRIRWQLGTANVGMAPVNGGNRPRIRGHIVDPDNLGNPVAFGATIRNCADLTATYTAGPTAVARQACRNFTLSGPFVEFTPQKDNLSGSGPFNPGQTVDWRLRVRTSGNSSDPVPLETVVATDLLPVDLEFSSWSFDPLATGLPAPDFEQIPNFAGTGRTLLRWTWPVASGNLAINSQVYLLVTTNVRVGSPNGSLSNTFNLEHDDPGLGQRCSSTATDSLDLDEDADSGETLCTAGRSINVAPIAQLISSKTILGTCDGGAGTTSNGTLLGGAIEYTLRVENVGTVALEDFVLIDILPFVGDTGVRDTNPRGSQWSPLLIAPIVPPPGTTLYYSSSGNPCRGEVGGPTTGCDAPDWNTVPPDPITSVRSFKVEFGDRVVGPSDFLDFSFQLTTPGDVMAGQVSLNSFAYQGERSDGLGSLAAEPAAVQIAPGSCVASSLGDYVWVDLDEDGIQDDGPTGLNGVFVRLFSTGADGIARTLDDVPLSSATTSDGPTGAAGWYNFPGLAAGNYYVQIERPPTFVMTTANATTDDLDSDGDPVTACSPVVILGPNQDDPTVDFGLIATEFAALGNYVWFDRNSDGIQNEPVTDGANGVSVRLLVDDGDNVPEPGGDDALIGTTVTSNDIHGRPGYYLFDGLVPGIRHLVQFTLPASATAFTSVDQGSDDVVDSDADSATGVTPDVILADSEVNLTIDAGLVFNQGSLALGDQVWLDDDDDGVFEPQDGEVGIDDVRLDLYRDVNGDGLPTLDEYAGATTTATTGGFAGRYRFDDLDADDWIVVVGPESFAGGGALVGLVTSTGNDPAPDPDDDVNGDDNGTDSGALTVSLAVTLSDGTEPVIEDGDNDTNLTVDFGFIVDNVAQPEYDYGDAPDVIAGTAQDDYNTTALDNGAFHRQGVAGSPYLGSCVDADDGFRQGVGALADDVNTFGMVTGVCSANDDEDGVSFGGPFLPGTVVSFDVSAAAGVGDCVLDAWVDWNRSGVFGDLAGEQIASSQTVTAGTSTVLTPTVPLAAVPGRSYARFRCSSAGGLPPTGGAADGEVEDYAIAIAGTDFGDLPDAYSTLAPGGASHIVDPGNPLILGQCVDTEGDGQPDPAASKDDLTPGTSRIGNCLDDEDGVTFDTVLTACQSAQVTIEIGAAGGLLDAWIDFNADSSFGIGEQIFTSQSVNPGVNVLGYVVPCNAVEVMTYARFRLSSAGGLSSDGAAPDGEVEDYAVNIGAVDFGDAPDSYATTFAVNGPNHGVVAGFSLGATVDSEADGQPSVGAIGDGADEDGVQLPVGNVLTACNNESLTVTLTNTAAIPIPRLDAWIDFDGDGGFDDPRDRIATSLAVASGPSVLIVAVPCDATPSSTYARFRLSSTGTAAPTGVAQDGEVEDYALTVVGLDYGDAGGGHPTLLANDGARHLVAPGSNPTLGPLVDTEGDGQPTAGIDGDDLNGDDEDGVIVTGVLVPGTTGSIDLLGGATGGLVSCWIDFGRNGTWSDPGDAIAIDFPLSPSTLSGLSFPVPATAVQGTAALRCRISSAGGLTFTGQAPDGEVEDHPVSIGAEDPRIGVSKQLISVGRTGDPVVFSTIFEVRIENFGNVALSDINATAAFAAVFTSPLSYSLVSLTSGDFVVNPFFDGDADVDLLSAGNTLAVGASGVITIELLVDSAGEEGPYYCTSVARGDSPSGVEVTDTSQDGGDVDPDGNNDPSDNDVPTEVVFPVNLYAIPALDTLGLALLAVLLLLIAVRRIRVVGES